MKTSHSMQKGFVWLPILLGVLAVLTASGGAWWYVHLTPNSPVKGENLQQEAPPVAQETTTGSGNCGLIINSLSTNAQVSFPLTITGVVDNSNAKSLGCSWQMFEGQAGTAQLYFNYNNEGWKPLGGSVPVPVADWAATKTSLAVTLNFNNGGIGLPNGTPLKVIFTAENAKGAPPYITFELPIILK